MWREPQEAENAGSCLVGVNHKVTRLLASTTLSRAIEEICYGR